MTMRPLDSSESSAKVIFKIPESKVATIDELAKRRSTNRSAVIREALEMLFEAEGVSASA